MYKLKDNERDVSDEGFAMYDEARAALKPIYNGMISQLLFERYGDSVRHVSGFGWVVTNSEV